MNLICDVCGREINPLKDGHVPGIISFDISFDEDGNKYLTNFNIHHKNIDGHYCDLKFRHVTRWVELGDYIGNIEKWLDLLDPKYSDGKHTTFDVSCMEVMMRCLVHGYDEARLYMKDYCRFHHRDQEPTITAKNCKEILAWAKK